MNLTLHHFELPVRHPFTISRGTTTVQRTLVVELEQDGVHGYGEAPEADYYGATIETMTAALQSARSEIEAHSLEDPTAFWEAMRPSLRHATFCQCAVDTAAHDLWGKLRGEPVWKLWGLDFDKIPPSDYTIGIDAIDVMVAKLNEFPGFPVYKIKLGTADDVEIVRRLREHTEARFRVDANCAWDARETIDNSASLRELGVEFIEQPLRPDAVDDMQEVRRDSELPIVADESCQVESDIDRCAGLFQGVNIKLVKCGGLTPARRMIDRARQLGMRVMVGCFTESTVGISAIAQLLPLVDYADIDGALLLAEDVASGVTIDRGKVVYPNENGCGVSMTTPLD
ncbi:MAG TPA: dipeptide epimerase [Thermoguttaceae bacterium]|nr:dipeptide epimerase [Thermoguttaceae bacterium]